MDKVSPTRILYLSYDGLTDPLGQSQILPYLSGLAKRGFSFTVISFEKKQALQKNRDTVSAICEENKIQWIALDYHKRPPVISTVYDLWTLWRQVKKVVGTNTIQVVHCRSYITSLVGQRAKRTWGVKFVFDMRGFWADERVEGGLWNLGNPLYRMVYNFFKKKEKQFIAEADHIVSLTHNAKKEIESWSVRLPRITVIPTCVDLDLFDPAKVKEEDQAHLREKLGISPNDFVLLYLGSWGTWYLTDEMLNFFSILKLKNANAKFLIVTEDKVNLHHYSHKEDVVISASTRAQVPLHISLASASVCFIKPSFSKKASAATKMGEVLAMDVPIIANTGWGDVDTIVDSTKHGVLISQLNSDTYREAVNWLSQSPSPSKFVWGLKRQFGLTQGIEDYQRIYSSLFKFRR